MIYKFVIVSDEADNFKLQISIDSTATFMELRNVILDSAGYSKEQIRGFIINDIGYDLSRTCDDIRPGYHHVESCQETVPEAITAFLEGTDFEDVIRTAVSLGGDCDTLTCIAGSIAEAFYGVPDELKTECQERLPEALCEILDKFAEDYQ